MEKLSANEQAYLVGRARAFQTLGFSDSQVKTAFVRDGIDPGIADELLKEAFGPAGLIGNLIARGGAALARGGGSLMARGAAKATAPAAKGLLGRVGRMGAGASQAVGGVAQRAGQGLVQSGRAFKGSPLKAMGGGALQAGQGMLFGGGKGLGGTIGKGIFGASTASMLMPGGDQPQIPQPYGQY